MKKGPWKRGLWLGLAMLAAWICYRGVRAHSKLVTLNVKDAEVRVVVRKIAWQTWEHVLVHREVRGRVTLDVRDVPLPEVLEMVARQAHCRWKVLHPLFTGARTLAAFRAGAMGDVPIAPGWSNLVFVVHSPRPPQPQNEVLPADATISLQLSNRDVHLAALALGRFANISVVPEDGTGGRVDMNLNGERVGAAVKQLAGIVHRHTTAYYSLLPMMGPGPGGPPPDMAGRPPPGGPGGPPPGGPGPPPQGTRPPPGGPPMPMKPPKAVLEQMQRDYEDLMAVLPTDQRMRLEGERNMQTAMEKMTPQQLQQTMEQSSSMLEARRQGLRQSTVGTRVNLDRRDQ